MFESNTDGVVELNVRAKKYYKPSAYTASWKVAYTFNKISVPKDKYDEALAQLAHDVKLQQVLINNYQPV